jgi:hypothetical protein
MQDRFRRGTIFQRQAVFRNEIAFCAGFIVDWNSIYL